MGRKTKNKIPTVVDYNKSLRSFESIGRKLFYHLTKAPFCKKSINNLTIINIKIGTSEHTMPLDDVAIILKSTDTIIKNICLALGYEENDISISLIEAGSGCFLLKIGIFLSSSAIQKYSTGFIEGLLNIDLEKEGQRQAEMIKDLFQSFVTSSKLSNATTPEANNIKDARRRMYMTLNNNKNIKNVNFTDNPDKKILCGDFLDFTV